MSFSSKIKEELARGMADTRHCNIAEIAAIINTSGYVYKNSKKNQYKLKVVTENASVARKYFTLLRKTFNISVEVTIKKGNRFHKKRIYSIYVVHADETKKVLVACHLMEKKTGRIKETYMNPMTVQSTCCKRAYIRGAFLATGSMSDPEKNYHLEFVSPNEEHAKALVEVLEDFAVDAKYIVRKKHYIVYLKEGKQIVDLLNVMEAHIALMDLENLRILKEMRNNVNRIVNCETANLKKTVSAAVRQIEDISYIEEKVGLHTLPETLEELAMLRKENSGATLKELGEMLSLPVGKSGVNHRLRKISQYAEKLRESMEE